MASLKWVIGKFKTTLSSNNKEWFCYVAKLPSYLQGANDEDELYIILPADNSGIIFCNKERAISLVKISKKANSRGKETPEEVPAELLEEIENRAKIQMINLWALKPWIFYEKIVALKDAPEFVFSEKVETSKQGALGLELPPIEMDKAKDFTPPPNTNIKHKAEKDKELPVALDF